MSLKICPRCIQYADDCECCKDCGGVECHADDCGEAITREIIRPARLSKITLRGLGVAEEVTGFETTETDLRCG